MQPPHNPPVPDPNVGSQPPSSASSSSASSPPPVTPSSQPPATPLTPPPFADEVATVSPDAPTIITQPADTASGAQPATTFAAFGRQAGQVIQDKGRGFWGGFRGLPRIAQVLIAVAAALVLMVCSCCSCSGFVAALGGGSPTVQTTVTSGPGNTQHGANSGQTGVGGITQRATVTTQPTATPEPTATATATATPTPRPIATATPTPRPKPQPTATPKPSCIPGAVNCNPWGYTFTNTGKYIYSPAGGFCNYFRCINNFSNGKGYVMECKDGMYSKSGGRSGSCSYHGGNLRPLYAP